MEYKLEPERVTTTGTPYQSAPQPRSLDSDGQIQRTRKILLIILSILLVLSIIGLCIAAFGPASGSQTNQDANRGVQISQRVLSILFYSFGIFVAYKYSTSGLRIFAWLNVILVVISTIALFFTVITTIISLVAWAPRIDTGVLTAGIVSFIIVTVIAIAVLILNVIIIKLTFKLSGLITANKNVVIQQS